MAFSSLKRRIFARLRTFGQATGANVTITFALATLPVMGAVGAAVDYGQANSIKSAMQAAADSTALMLARDAHTLTDDQLRTQAQAFFKAQFKRDVENLQISATYVAQPGSQVNVSATGTMRTDFMQMMGFSTLDIGVNSQVRWGNERLRVSLVLDVTGSMARDGKMTALKEAARSFLTELENAASRDGDVYVSIIPFNKNVNVGSDQRDEDWVRWDLWDQNNGSCKNYDGRRRPTTKSSCEAADGRWTATKHSSWSGCVTDRDQDYDTTNTAPSTHIRATQFPAENYSQCPARMMGLTYDWQALNDKIDELEPVGNTNQTIGLQWGFQSLTQAPFTIPAKDSNYQYSEVIILMTDGDNTENRFSRNKSSIDARTTAACENVKAAGITLYTIQVNTEGTPTQEFLRDCASTQDKFHLVESAGQIASTFQAIGNALSNLRVAQ